MAGLAWTPGSGKQRKLPGATQNARAQWNPCVPWKHAGSPGCNHGRKKCNTQKARMTRKEDLHRAAYTRGKNAHTHLVAVPWGGHEIAAQGRILVPPSPLQLILPRLPPCHRPANRERESARKAMSGRAEFRSCMRPHTNAQQTTRGRCTRRFRPKTRKCSKISYCCARTSPQQSVANHANRLDAPGALEDLLTASSTLVCPTQPKHAYVL